MVIDEDLKALFADVGAKIKEVSEQIAETDATLKAQIAETDAKLAARIAKTEAQLARTSREVGNIGRGRGEIAEEFFYRSLSADPQVGGIHFDHVYRHWAHGVGDLSDEYDVILVNGDQLLLVEVKARASINDLFTLINRKIPNFRVLFPNYKNYNVLGAIASLTAPDELIAKAQELGVFFLTRQAKHLTLVNDKAKTF